MKQKLKIESTYITSRFTTPTASCRGCVGGCERQGWFYADALYGDTQGIGYHLGYLQTSMTVFIGMILDIVPEESINI